MSVNKAIKEANKMADKAILTSKLEQAKKATLNWMIQEVDGFQRWHIISVVILPILLIMFLG
jgi:hypothetical protein